MADRKKTTIALDASERELLRFALIDHVGCETDRVDGALTRGDRDRHLQAAREGMRRIGRIGKLLDRVGWKPKERGVSLRLEVDRDLELVVCALRDSQCAAYDGARDANAHDDARYLQNRRKPREPDRAAASRRRPR
jgi:hypothetical protein